MKNSCSTCKFFEKSNNFCRRFPPIVVIEHKKFFESGPNSDKVTKEVALTKFPVIVKPTIDWCGEWQDGDGQENFV